MGVFGALGRWMKAAGYLLTGRIDSARKALDANPNVMNAKYDEMIRAMSIKIKQYVDAAAKVSSNVARKKAALQVNSAEIEKLDLLKNGAINRAKSVAEKLQAKGIDPNADVEYTQHRSAYNDFSSTLVEKMKTRKELEDAVKQGEDTNKNNLFTLKGLQREYENLKSEQGEMVGRMISAAQERELNEMVSGLSADTGNIGSERSKIREMVMEAEAGAKITGQVAGTDARRAEDEYISAAIGSAANDEFDNIVGIIKKEPALLTDNSNAQVIDVSIKNAESSPVSHR